MGNGNPLSYGIPEHLLNKLQKVHNGAAHLVTGALKYDHITPVLAQLHWWRIKQRITFKLLLIAYRVLWQVSLQVTYQSYWLFKNHLEMSFLQTASLCA